MSIWDASIELANTVYTGAYVALVVGAILTAVATMSLFWASAVRDKYADTQISGARVDAAKANERASILEATAAGLEKEAAEAKERTAGLEHEAADSKAIAEEARAEQERLKVNLVKEQIERLKFQGEFAWRTITVDDGKNLVKLLAASPSTVRLGFVANDPEATFLAIQFEKIFIDAGWTVVTSANTYSGVVFFGLIVSDVPSPSLVPRVIDFIVDP